MLPCCTQQAVAVSERIFGALETSMLHTDQDRQSIHPNFLPRWPMENLPAPTSFMYARPPRDSGAAMSAKDLQRPELHLPTDAASSRSSHARTLEQLPTALPTPIHGSRRLLCLRIAPFGLESQTPCFVLRSRSISASGTPVAGAGADANIPPPRSASLRTACGCGVRMQQVHVLPGSEIRKGSLSKIDGTHCPLLKPQY